MCAPRGDGPTVCNSENFEMASPGLVVNGKSTNHEKSGGWREHESKKNGMKIVGGSQYILTENLFFVVS